MKVTTLADKTTQGRHLSTMTDFRVVTIRSYQNSDYEDCREIFTQGMEQLIGVVTRVIFLRLCWFLVVLGVILLLGAIKWSLWIFPLYVFACLVVLALLYAFVYVRFWKYINSSLATDLKDIDKSYMSADGCHMWVAEWRGKVVGMVGLVQNEGHKAGVAELQRMSVSPVCRRMGIARKLLDELLKHAKEHRFEQIVLTTSSAQTPAIRLYKKYGFKLQLTVSSFLHKILGDFKFMSFYLQL